MIASSTHNLINVTPIDNSLIIDLKYATADNFTKQPVYKNAYCYLHKEAYDCLIKSHDLAKTQGLGLRIFDAFRPQEAQEKLWSIVPDPNYICPPEKGSPHSRGVAVDLTLFDLATGEDLEMGTPFDDFTKTSHHGAMDISKKAIENRFLLMGLMTTAGWDFFRNEWWHYQLFNARETYDLIYDRDAKTGIMTE